MAAKVISLLRVCSRKMLPRWERIFRLWKISAMDMVTKAMVVPSGLRPLAGISHIPDSMKWPMKKAAMVRAEITRP